MIHLSDKTSPLHEKLEIGLLLAIVGGFLDAYSYLCYGGVFANAQTGNMVLLGLAIVDGDFTHFIHYLIPIIAFSLGILITEYLLKYLSGSFYIWVLVIEIVLLFIIAFLPNDVSPVIVTAAISFMCSIQIGSFRKICGAPYTSTMCTGNLRSAMGALFVAISAKDRDSLIQSLRYVSIILFFCIGAALGAIFINCWGKISILVCCLLFLILLLLIIRDLVYIKRLQKRLNNAIKEQDVS